MSRILITNNHLAQYGGSEIITLEVAEEFAARGWEVDVFANFTDAPFMEEFKKIDPANSVSLSDQDTFDATDTFDLAWVQHGVLPASVIESFTSRSMALPLVWNHMSTIPGIESPILADIETMAASGVFFNSFETQEALLQYGIPRDLGQVFPNPAPRAFTHARLAMRNSDELRTLLIVSNHPPSEIADACSSLEALGITVESVGGDAPSRVTPSTFDNVDAVITIGKSVQYALCLGIPAYVYDHFGGPGWLSSDNFEAAASFNFSGRPDRRKIDGAALAIELVEGFAAARTFAQEHVSEYRLRFSLEQYVDTLLADFAGLSSPVAPLSAPLVKRWSAYARIQRDNTRAINGAWIRNNELGESVATLQEDQVCLRAEIDQLRTENQLIRDSRSYRFGRFFTQPLSKLLRK